MRAGVARGSEVKNSWATLVKDENHFVYNDQRAFSFGTEPKDGAVHYKSVVYDAAGNMTIDYEVCEEAQISYEDTPRGEFVPIARCVRKSSYKKKPHYFDLISIDVVELKYLPAQLTADAGTAVITYAGFLDYIEEKKGTDQAATIASYCIDGASLAFGVGEIALIIKAGANAGRVALATIDLGSQVADLVIGSEAFAEAICGKGNNDCAALANIRNANTLAQLAALGGSVFDVSKNWSKLNLARFSKFTRYRNVRKLPEKALAKLEASRWSDDVLKALDEDLANAVLRGKFFERPDLVENWKRAFDLFPSGSKFITDIPTLDRIAKLAAEGSAFRAKLGSNWSQALDDILRTANDLKCSSCGNAGRIGRSSMDQYLDDVDHFVSNFTITPGGKGEVFYNWMRNATNPTSGQLDELHQTIRDFAKRGIKESEVEGLGKQFPIGTKKYDLRRVGDKYTEYKNKDFVNSPLTPGSDDVDQFINGYLKNVKSMDDLEWKAGFDKLKNAWGSEANALAQMKSQWKSIFENKADEVFEVIWDNQNLRNGLFGNLASSETNSRALFNTLVKNTDDKIFKFIMVE